MLARLLVTGCVMGGLCAGAIAQGAFPAPLPNQSSQYDFQKAAPPVGGFPSGQSAAGTAEQKECMAKFAPLRASAENRARMITAARARKTTAREACGLIEAYVAAEKELVDYVTDKRAACNIPADVADKLKANQVRSVQMLKSACEAAKKRPPYIDPPRRLDPPGPERYGSAAYRDGVRS